MAKQSGPTQHHLLIEVGMEEIPAGYLIYGDADHQAFFRQGFKKAFDAINADASLKLPDDYAVYLTPRRIILDINGIAFDGKAKEEWVYGPSPDKAYDSAGKPTPMLEGFVKSKGIALKDLVKVDNKGRECLAFKRSIKPVVFKAKLQTLVETFLKDLTFPKLMVWDETRFKFPRPIRSLLVFLDSKPVTVKAGGLASKTLCRIYAQGGHPSLTVKTPRAYYQALKKNGILWDQSRRYDKIKKDVAACVKASKAHAAEPEELFYEVAFLTERPHVLVGRFDQNFAKLPPEVLTSSLSKSQRLFSLVDASSRHLPYFVAVLDGKPKEIAQVTANIAAILKAKLQDSRFFYQEDMKVYSLKANPDEGIERLMKSLGDFQYLKGLGSVGDKVARLKSLAGKMHKPLGVESKDEAVLMRAIAYSKVDLLTQIVGEFPELQGVISRYYLTEANGPDWKAVGQAIEEQYWPRSFDSQLPASSAGAALSLLDRADLIVSCFVLGKVPSSSQDPYALKRSLNGILRILSHFRLNISIKSINEEIIKSVKEQKHEIEFDSNAILSKLSAFYRERTAFFFERQGFRGDWVEAVLAVEADRPLIIEERLQALKRLASSASFEKTRKVIERTTNILRGVKEALPDTVKPEFLKEEEERRLYEAWKAQAPLIRDAWNARDYEKGVNLYAGSFFDILHVFFERVLVNIEDPDIRRNRLSLLKGVRSLYVDHMADLSKIKVI